MVAIRLQGTILWAEGPEDSEELGCEKGLGNGTTTPNYRPGYVEQLGCKSLRTLEGWGPEGTTRVMTSSTLYTILMIQW